MHTMKAYVIDSQEQTVTPIQWSTYKDLQAVVGGLICSAYQYLDGDDRGDTLFVDDEGLLKAPRHFFRWLDRADPMPLAGNGILVGPEAMEYIMDLEEYEGPSNEPPTLTLEEVKARVRFMTLDQAMAWGKANASEPLQQITTFGADGQAVTETLATVRDIFPRGE